MGWQQGFVNPPHPVVLTSSVIHHISKTYTLSDIISYFMSHPPWIRSIIKKKKKWMSYELLGDHNHATGHRAIYTVQFFFNARGETPIVFLFPGQSRAPLLNTMASWMDVARGRCEQNFKNQEKEKQCKTKRWRERRTCGWNDSRLRYESNRGGEGFSVSKRLWKSGKTLFGDTDKRPWSLLRRLIISPCSPTTRKHVAVIYLEILEIRKVLHHAEPARGHLLQCVNIHCFNVETLVLLALFVCLIL